MSKEHINLGIAGEGSAGKLLKDNGYKVIARNYRCIFGEIDLIAMDNDIICFIEVKTRSSPESYPPLESVTAAKQKQISKVAMHYLKENALLDRNARFDVIAVCAEGDDLRAQIIKDAFELGSGFVY